MEVDEEPPARPGAGEQNCQALSGPRGVEHQWISQVRGAKAKIEQPGGALALIPLGATVWGPGQFLDIQDDG